MTRSMLSSGAFFLVGTLPTVAVFFWILGGQPGSNAPSLHSTLSQPGEVLGVTQGTGDAR